MIYDGFLLLALWMLAAAIIIIPLDAAVAPGNIAFQLYLILVAWAYLAICWRKGQTLGMRAWRVRLVSHRPEITWVATMIRFVVSLASLFCLGLGFLWSWFHPHKATWHDLASGTFLVTTPGRSSNSFQQDSGKQNDQQGGE